MSASQIDAVLTALYSTLSADASIVAAGVAVYDGPVITEAADLERIVVGASADGEDPTAGQSTQDWRSDGGTSASRDEFITVPIVVMSRSGDTDMSTRRARCGVLVGYVEAALRANYTLGLAQVAWVEVTGHRLSQVATAKGSVVYDELTITARALI